MWYADCVGAIEGIAFFTSKGALFMTVFEYAKENASKLFREPDGQLKCPFIVPGATYQKELWDWDSWLTDVALCQVSDEDLSQLQQGCILNFLDHMELRQSYQALTIILEFES